MTVIFQLIPEPLMHRTGVLLAALFVSSLPDLASQGRPVVGPGNRVRVTTHTTQRFVGTLLGERGDSLFLRVEGQPIPVGIPKHAIEAVDISDGVRSKAGKGALIGFGLGVVGGAVAGAVDASKCPSFCFFSPASEAVISGLVFGAGGAAVGALIGSLNRSERWKPAAVE